MADEARLPPSAPRALLTGGGSGGHVFPALAVGAELGRRGWSVSYAGTPEGMERGLVAARGIEFVAFAARPLVGRSPLARLRAAATLVRSAGRARRWIRAHGVDLVLGTGGYASAPAVLGAAWARRPALLVEPNARAGAANRWLSRFAAGAATAFDETGGDLRCPSRVTGVPVRAPFFEVPELGVGAPPRLLVLGGSQGARALNELVPAAARDLLQRLSGLAVVHQCGERHLTEVAAAWEATGAARERYRVVAFLDDVARELGRASLVVSRAGAITLAELCAAGRPSLLVPLELAGGHQRQNAEHLRAHGAAELFAERGATAAELATRLGELLGDGARLAAMGRRARELARPGAAAAIADRAGELLRARR